MSSYNVNASVPKTLVIYLVRWYALHRADKDLSEALLRILDTPISPELVPAKEGETNDVSQHTESIIGPYELHDFFIYHYLRKVCHPEVTGVCRMKQMSVPYLSKLSLLTNVCRQTNNY